MSTSSNGLMASQTPMVQVSAHAALKMAQTAGMIVPPAYLISSLVLRRGAGFSVRRMMSVTVNTTVAAAGIGALAGWGRLRNQPIEAIEDRTYRLAHSPTQIHVDDFSVMGATLGGLLVPAVFLKRAPLPMLALGGASIGLGAGSWMHIAQMFGSGEKVRPEGMVGEIPVVGGNK